MHNALKEKKKIFITGISSSLIRSFLPLINLEKYETYGLTRKSELLDLRGVHVVQGDLQDFDSYSEHLLSCDLIIHAAAVTHSFDEQEYFKINFELTKSLVDLLKARQNKFIYISTRCAEKGAGAYGESKLFAENYIQDHMRSWIIIRPSEIFGGNGSEGVDKLIQDCMLKKLMFCPSMTPELHPLFINDFAEILNEIIFSGRYENQKVTVSGNEGYSYIELVKLIKLSLGNRSLVFPLPKAIVYLLKSIIKTLDIKTSITPDQVDRLYVGKLDGDFKCRDSLDLKQYLKRLSHNTLL